MNVAGRRVTLCARFGAGATVLGLLGCLALGRAWGSDSAKHAAGPGNDKATAAQPGDRAAADQSKPLGSSRVGDDYTIGPSDVLAVNIWKDTEITRTVLVRPDGRISLPLVGELEVNGLTALNVQHLVVQRLREYIDNPQVTVIVQEVRSRTYVVIGKVAKPGSYELGKPTTVLEAIAIAGGFQDFAKTSKVFIIRRLENESVQKLPFDYKTVTKGRHIEENVDLQNGDTVVVP